VRWKCEVRSAVPFHFSYGGLFERPSPAPAPALPPAQCLNHIQATWCLTCPLMIQYSMHWNPWRATWCNAPVLRYDVQQNTTVPAPRSWQPVTRPRHQCYHRRRRHNRCPRYS